MELSQNRACLRSVLQIAALASSYVNWGMHGANQCSRDMQVRIWLLQLSMMHPSQESLIAHHSDSKKLDLLERKKKHYICIFSQLGADQMPGPPQRGPADVYTLLK